MKVICLHSREEIEPHLLSNPYLHLYELGDLDPFFWPYTTWYASRDSKAKGCVLVYSGTELPVLLALADEPLNEMRELLSSALPYLPRRFYAHLSGDLHQVITGQHPDSDHSSPAQGTDTPDRYRVEAHGKHLKMALAELAPLEAVDTSEVRQLGPEDQEDLESLYREAYPQNWFDPRMLETGCYYGIRRGGAIVSVAGVHVYSPRYRVAALGNITTHPAYRGQGLAAAVSARLCLELCKQVDAIGLNVKADNASAIRCYQKLGFRKIGEYGEFMVEAVL